MPVLLPPWWECSGLEWERGTQVQKALGARSEAGVGAVSWSVVGGWWGFRQRWASRGCSPLTCWSSWLRCGPCVAVRCHRQPGPQEGLAGAGGQGRHPSPRPPAGSAAWQKGQLQGTWPHCPMATEALCSSPHHLLSLCPRDTPARQASSCLVTGDVGYAPASEPGPGPDCPAWCCPGGNTGTPPAVIPCSRLLPCVSLLPRVPLSGGPRPGQVRSGWG